ncbi:MAG: TnpV protein [Clostridiales bacterium]|nr:TnpV protein [Clostridiales bacterium]
MTAAHLWRIDESCNNRMEIICKAMAEREGVTETLKAS